MADWFSEDLPGQFAVWLASKEASYLHGRFLWASWDVEELAKSDVPKRVESDHYFLKTALGGTKGGLRA